MMVSVWLSTIALLQGDRGSHGERGMKGIKGEEGDDGVSGEAVRKTSSLPEINTQNDNVRSQCNIW